MAVQAWAWEKGRRTGKRIEAGALTQYLDDPTYYVWVDLDASGPEDERVLREVFDLHPLVVEDVMQDSRPKLEQHRHFLYIIAHGISPAGESPQHVVTQEVDLLVGERFLLTHHAEPIRAITAVRGLVEKRALPGRVEPAFIAHAILDRMVDRFMPLMGRFEETLGSLEVEVLTQTSNTLLERIFELKRSLQRLRRITHAQRRVIEALASVPEPPVEREDEEDLRESQPPGPYSDETDGEESSFLDTQVVTDIKRLDAPPMPQALRPFFRDVADHFGRVADQVDEYRDMASAVLDGYLTVQSHRMNEVMKVLTMISTFMLPMTFITGLYGMNFASMPELTWKHGYAFAWATMITVASSLVFFFKRRGWL